MDLFGFVFVGLLFFALVPGILVSLPKGGSKFMVAGVHAVIFGLIYYFNRTLRFGRLFGFKERMNQGGAIDTSKYPCGNDDECKKHDSSKPYCKDKKEVPGTGKKVGYCDTCFSANETILLESGEYVPIHTIRVGDRVLASDKFGKMSYSDVIAIPHGQNEIESEFIQITTTTNKTIQLTPDHFILARENEFSPFTLKTASKVNIGDSLYTVDGAEYVQSISSLTLKGIYTIVTKEEYVVVSGFVASPFAVSHLIPHLFYDAFRVLYTFAPAVVKNDSFIAAHQQFSSLIRNI